MSPAIASPPSPPKGPALVLSGGGVRGAYEVGVVRGMVEALGLGADDPAPFRIFAGTSVGAINATYLAANAHRGDMGIAGLEALWQGLSLDTHLRIEILSHLPGLRRLRWPGSAGRGHGWSLLDPGPLARLVHEGIDWSSLHKNSESGTVIATVVAALNIASGRTTMFAELSPEASFRPSRDPLRAAECGPLSPDHVLASAALPAIFPARRIGDDYYCDGGLRFNTPIAPAIRTGADRLAIIPTVMRARSKDLEARRLTEYPRLSFLVGKLLNALLADPLQYDLQVLARFNLIVEVLEDALTADELARVHDVTIANRGAPYRKLRTLVIRPSQDIGVLAGDYVRSNKPGQRLPGLEGLLFRYARRKTKVREADWASYVLFEGGFAQELIALGRLDALAQADEIRAFFA